MANKNWTRRRFIRELDAVFSKLIRMRDGWRCQRCHKKYTPPTNALHNSHFWKRGYMETRWDFNNCDAVCYGCHRLIEGDKQKGSWYYEWKLQQLGDKEFEAMQKRAQSYKGLVYEDLETLLEIFSSTYEKQKKGE